MSHLGAAAVLAQFNIDQFRSIAWFNVAFGVAFIVLQVAIFKGESSFTKLKSQCANWKLRKFNYKAAPQEVAVSSNQTINAVCNIAVSTTNTNRVNLWDLVLIYEPLATIPPKSEPIKTYSLCRK